MAISTNKERNESYGRFLRRAGDCLDEKYQTYGNKLSFESFFDDKNTVSIKKTEAKCSQLNMMHFSNFIEKERDPVKRLGQSLRLAGDMMNDKGPEEELLRMQNKIHFPIIAHFCQIMCLCNSLEAFL